MSPPVPGHELSLADRAALPGVALAVAVGLSLAFPPDVHPEAGVAIALLLLAGLALARRWPRGGPVLLGLSVVLFNLAVSLAPGRTVVALTRLALPVAAAALAAAVAPGARRLTHWMLGGVGAGLGLLAVAQKVFLHAEQARILQSAGGPALFIERLQIGRPYGEHGIPAALAGALTLCLAGLGGLAPTGVRRLWLVLLAAPMAAGLVLTGSVGGLLGAVAGAVVVVAPVLRRRPPRKWLIVVGVAAAVVVALVLARPGGVSRFTRPDNPLSLREGNWRGALLVAAERPVAGVGLGGFGALYPAVRRAADVETIYAHNSWLQLVAEGGLPACALLAAAAICLWRSARRRDLAGAERWALAGGIAFAVHNLVDFTAYLPGVAISAAALLGFVFARKPAPGETAGDSGRPAAEVSAPKWPANLAAGVFALLLLAAAILWFGETKGRRGLERAEALRAEGAFRGAAGAAAGAARSAPWNPTIVVQAGRILLAADDAADRFDPERMAADLARIDFESPAPWHLLGDAALARQRPVRAWWDWRMALARHPADSVLQQTVQKFESELAANGFLSGRLEYGGAPARPLSFPWESWDRLLLLLEVAALLLVLERWRSGRGAPPWGAALVLILVASAWGEGGALPSVRFGRELLLGAGLLALLWPRRREPGQPMQVDLPLAPAIALLPAALWAALATVVAPDRALARDGLVALLSGLVLIVLAWRLSLSFDRWPEVVLRAFIAVAALAALLWLAQKLALAWGVDLSRTPTPLRVDLVRPAGDFLHPGHLGTYLVAAALGIAAVTAAAAVRGLRWGLAPGVLLTLGLLGAGVSGGARATLLALFAGGVVLVATAPQGVIRKAMAGVVLAGLVLGAGAVAWRFAHGVPFALSRTGIWRACLHAAADRPWTGAGPGAFAPLARAYTFPDSTGVAQYGKVFQGPHSDLVGAFVNLGVPGGVLLLAALGWLSWRALRGVLRRRDWIDAGLLAALAAFAAHSLVDDLFSERPAAAVFAAIALGVLAARGAAGDRLWRLSLAQRLVATTVIVTGLLGGEATPWLAHQRYLAGEPLRAALMDRGRANFWIAAARTADGPTAERLALALDRTGRAIHALPEAADPWAEQARVLEAACVGPLRAEETCRASVDAWRRAIELQPVNPFAFFERARLEAMLGDLPGAERDLRAALAQEPAFLAARLELARTLADEGRLDDARAALADLKDRVRALRAAKPASAYEAELLALSRQEVEDIQRRLGGP